jgi:anti-sigma B factor antagonist
MFSIERQDTDGGCRIAVSGEMTIYSAAELKAKLIEAAGAARAVECDLTEVSDFDSTGVQLVLLLQRAATDIGGSMRVTGASDAVRELLDLYRLSGELISAAGASDQADHSGRQL